MPGFLDVKFCTYLFHFSFLLSDYYVPILPIEYDEYCVRIQKKGPWFVWKFGP